MRYPTHILTHTLVKSSALLAQLTTNKKEVTIKVTSRLSLINAFSYELLQTSSFSLQKASRNVLSYELLQERLTLRKNA